MIEYLVIGLCLLLLVLVVFISARPISMGIEARRNINHNNTSDNIENDQEIALQKSILKQHGFKINSNKIDN